MTLEWLREQAVRRSGRNDLVGTKTVAGALLPDFSIDNGIDEYINEGLRMVCDRLPSLLDVHAYTATLTVGQYEVPVPRLRAASVVRIEDTEDRYPMLGKSERSLRDAYAAPFASVTSGTPMYWAQIPRSRTESPSWLRSFGSDTWTPMTLVESDGELYIPNIDVDTIHVVDSEGAAIRTIGVNGNEDGEFDDPYDVAFLGYEIYVADSENSRVQVFNKYTAAFLRKFSNGDTMVTPSGIAVLNNEIYVCDSGTHTITVYRPDGTLLRSWGSEGWDDGEFQTPRHIAACDRMNRLFVVDQGKRTVDAFDTEGTFLFSLEGDFSYPYTATVHDDRIYVTDLLSVKVYVHRTSDGKRMWTWDLTRGETDPLEFINVTAIAFWNNEIYLGTGMGTYPIRVFTPIIEASQQIVFMPPTDTAYTLRVDGTFYPEPLVNPWDTNVILRDQPYLLIKAVLVKLAEALGVGQQAEERIRDFEIALTGPANDEVGKTVARHQDVNGRLTMRG